MILKNLFASLAEDGDPPKERIGYRDIAIKNQRPESAIPNKSLLL